MASVNAIGAKHRNSAAWRLIGYRCNRRNAVELVIGIELARNWHIGHQAVV